MLSRNDGQGAKILRSGLIFEWENKLSVEKICFFIVILSV